jgi:hypothetical protein
MEYCAGGDLYYYLKKNSRFSINMTRLICAELVLGKNYLKKKKKKHTYNIIKINPPEKKKIGL